MLGWAFKRGFKMLLNGLFFKGCAELCYIGAAVYALSSILYVVQPKPNVPAAINVSFSTAVSLLLGLVSYYIYRKLELPYLITPTNAVIQVTLSAVSPSADNDANSPQNISTASERNNPLQVDASGTQTGRGDVCYLVVLHLKI